MIGGIAYIISAVYSSITGTGEAVDLPNRLLYLVWALGAICGWLAIIQLRGTGENIIVRFLSFVPIIGLSLAAISAVYEMTTSGSITFNPMTAIGLMLETVGAVLVGIFAVAARRLAGWHRFTPFFVVLGVVAGGLVSGASNGAIMGIPLFIGIAYTLLGYAVRTEEKVSLVDQSVKAVPG
jgi:predicted membrane channel-forming protein YqfA (hemolysin III family)